MKILVLIHEFPPIGGGGGHVALDLAKGLHQRGHEIVLVTAHYPGLAKEEMLDGLRVIRVPSLRRELFRASFLSMLAYITSGLWACLRLTKEWRPDIVHVHFAVPAGVLAWILSHIKNIPYVLTAHLGDVPGGAPEKTDQWFRWILPQTHKIWRGAKKAVAVSEFTRALALNHYDVDVDVIHNGVDLDSLPAGDITVNSPPLIVFAGRFAEQKNPLQIVRTLATLNELPWKCVMVGDGPLALQVKDEVAEQGLSERFTFTGWISPEDVLTWLSKSDILFMPSLSEGLPVIGVQALAMGLAMVVSHIGGFVDLVGDGENGYLVDAPSDFEWILRRLLSSPRELQKLRTASREKAKNFSVELIVSKYEALLVQQGLRIGDK